MAKSRLSLQSELENLLGSRKVFFQPPPTIESAEEVVAKRLSYPCIIYELADYDIDHADDIKYGIMKRYSITVMDKNPDSELPDKLIKLEYCSFDRFYTIDNLNHWVFTLFY